MVPDVGVTCAAAMVPPDSVPPLTTTSFASVLPLRSSVPALTVMVLVPKAESPPARRMPEPTVVAPE